MFCLTNVHFKTVSARDACTYVATDIYFVSTIHAIPMSKFKGTVLALLICSSENNNYFSKVQVIEIRALRI